MQNTARRLKIIIIFVFIIILALMCRLAYIQLIGGSELAEVTNAQSLIALEGSNTRGMIYDRNGAALVADSRRYVYIIKKSDFDFQTGKLLKETDAVRINSDNDDYYVYSSADYDKIAGKKLIENHNAYVLQASARYSEEQLAEHLIGYVNKKDLSGAAGLELMFDEQLNPLNRRVYAAADVNGNLLPGRGLIITSDKHIDSSIKEGIRTTLDKELQAAVEDITDDYDGCAVVVLDTASGGVAAMSCSPGFDPNRIEDYMTGNGSELVNKATQGEYAPGSVFKIVVAAAALEKNISPEKTFKCAGSVQVGALEIKCDTGGDEGHGEIGMHEAFASSCNSYFVQLGKQLGSDTVIEYAEKMQLGKNTIDGYPQESSGHLMTEEQRQGAAIGNLSIGQGETLVTPVQIAAMTNIIASGGMNRGVKVLMEDETDEERVISEETAEKIGAMMQAVSEEGTAKSLQLEDSSGRTQAAVKTGTAEFGSGNEYGTNAWITGYTPCEDPEYVITVLVENGESGAMSAGPVFKAIVEYLKTSGSYSRPTLA